MATTGNSMKLPWSGRVIDALRGFLKVAGLGPEDIGDEGLRVAVVEREPARLDLHHDSWPGRKTWFAVGRAKR